MVCIKFYSGALLTEFLKLSWPSLDPAWNKVTGLSTPAVCPKVWEPWEKSEAWPYKHDPATSTTEQQKQLRAPRDGKSLLLQWRISRPRTHRVTQTKATFSNQESHLLLESVADGGLFAKYVDAVRSLHSRAWRFYYLQVIKRFLDTWASQELN